MIIALFALAFAMIVGGLFAAILGWDIVLVERGWTMVISGSISAASGALLLGVTAIVSKLSRIEAELMRLQANLVEEEAEVSGALPAAAGMSLAALAGGLLGKRKSEAAAGSIGREDKEPALPLFAQAEEVETAPAPEVSRPTDAGVVREGLFKPRTGFGSRQPSEPETGPSRPVEPETPPAEDEAKVPEFLFAERFRETSYTEVRIPEPEREEIAKEPEPKPADRAEWKPEVEPETETETKSEAETEAAAPEEAAAEEPQEVSVIGTYNSGDNKYVMYSDGSIEAETPQGMFKFKSLDELKEFIATGEGGTRIT